MTQMLELSSFRTFLHTVERP